VTKKKLETLEKNCSFSVNSDFFFWGWGGGGGSPKIKKNKTLKKNIIDAHQCYNLCDLKTMSNVFCG
jgi:hypothetical protein